MSKQINQTDMKLHKLLEGKVVNCRTEEEAKDLLLFFHERGYKWIAGNSFIGKSYWGEYKENTCYNLCVDMPRLQFAYTEHYKTNKYEIITYQQFKRLIKDMETKEVKIQVPEGYEIDRENSTFDCIKFRPIKKVVTYEDVAKELFSGKDVSHFTSTGDVNTGKLADCYLSDANNCTSEKQAKKLLAINKLMNVAKYLNGDWKPDWNTYDKDKYFIKYNTYSRTIDFGTANVLCSDIVHFKSEDLAQQAIEILGEETIKLALSTDW